MTTTLRQCVAMSHSQTNTLAAALSGSVHVHVRHAMHAYAAGPNLAAVLARADSPCSWNVAGGLPVLVTIGWRVAYLRNTRSICAEKRRIAARLAARRRSVVAVFRWRCLAGGNGGTIAELSSTASREHRRASRSRENHAVIVNGGAPGEQPLERIVVESQAVDAALRRSVPLERAAADGCRHRERLRFGHFPRGLTRQILEPAFTLHIAAPTGYTADLP